MTDKFDIINGALVRIGANEIMSFEDDTVEATTARRLYPNTVKDLASRYPWRFLMNTKQMSRLDVYVVPPNVHPPDKWDAAYQLPMEAEVLRSVRINDHPIAYERYQDQIFCDAGVNEAVFAEYVMQLHEQYFPGYFCTLLEFELAANLAIPVGDRGDLAELYTGKALKHFSLAKNLDAQGRTARRLHIGRFVAARWGTR